MGREPNKFVIGELPYSPNKYSAEKAKWSHCGLHGVRHLKEDSCPKCHSAGMVHGRIKYINKDD